RTFADGPTRDADPILSPRVLDTRLHYAGILTLRCQAVPNRVRCRVGFAAGADLAVDVCDVPRDGAEAEDEFARYFGIGAAGGDEAQDLSFANCEVVWISGLLRKGKFADTSGIDGPHRPYDYCIRHALQPLLAVVLEP